MFFFFMSGVVMWFFLGMDFINRGVREEEKFREGLRGVRNVK